mmetsp:Transcript_559/g.1536  ORF Transcript_559/g.1536 Transcript_559/m.1536 type:complete len:206 (-) Transcript_559:213-830(-)
MAASPRTSVTCICPSLNTVSRCPQVAGQRSGTSMMTLASTCPNSSGFTTSINQSARRRFRSRATSAHRAITSCRTLVSALSALAKRAGAAPQNALPAQLPSCPARTPKKTIAVIHICQGQTRHQMALFLYRSHIKRALSSLWAIASRSLEDYRVTRLLLSLTHQSSLGLSRLLGGTNSICTTRSQETLNLNRQFSRPALPLMGLR